MAAVRASRGVVPLLVAIGLFFASIGVVMWRAQEQMRLEADSQRVSVWYTTQALVEVHRLRSILMQAARGDRGAGPDAVQDRYEILLSRLPLLLEGEEATAESLAGRPDEVFGVIATLEAIERDVEVWRPGATVPQARIEAALDEADLLLTRLNLALHVERSDATQAARAHARQFNVVAITGLGGLLAAAALLLLLIRRSARRTRDAEAALRSLVDALPVAVAAYDREGRVLMRNEASRTLLAMKDGTAWPKAFRAKAAAAHAADIAEALATRRPLPTSELILPQDDGSERTILVTTAPILDASGAVTRVVRVGLDITEQRTAHRRMRHLAEHDALTDLPNRLLFGTRLTEAIARAEPGHGVAVHCIDIDHFKDVNDSLGHPIGDQLLLAAAARMRGVLRDGDVLARLGGDEFAVIQHEVRDTAEAEAVATRLCAVLARDYTLSGFTLRSGASIGTAISPEHGTTVEALLSRADIALYSAKGAGRGRPATFTTEQETGLRDRRALEDGLREAIAGNGLYLVYQPKFSVADGKVHGVEALLRWHHPERGLISPALFIPVAEETGLIDAITAQALRMACLQAMTWRAAGLRLPVAVNLSAAHFGAGLAVQMVEQALAATDCEPSLIEVEVTEGVFLRNVEAATRSFTQLRSIGVRVSLDDFGTGYSSLAYLQHLPFDVIKIDRSFIKGLDQDGPGQRIVDAIVRLAHGLGAQVVAEGVETEEQLSELRRLRCDQVQGFLLSRPLTGPAVAELVNGAARRGRRIA